MYEHEWVPSENDTRRHCKHCGIYEDYADKFPVCSGADDDDNDHQPTGTQG